MPGYFKELFYDYFLVFIMIFAMIVASIGGLILSYTSKHNPNNIMFYICNTISICIIIWALWIARVSFSEYTGYMLYSMYFMITLAIAIAIQLILMSTYVNLIYKTTMFRIMLIMVLVLAFITAQYKTTSEGMLMYNVLGICISISAVFIIVTVITSRFTYYLRNS